MKNSYSVMDAAERRARIKPREDYEERLIARKHDAGTKAERTELRREFQRQRLARGRELMDSGKGSQCPEAPTVDTNHGAPIGGLCGKYADEAHMQNKQPNSWLLRWNCFRDPCSQMLWWWEETTERWFFEDSADSPWQRFRCPATQELWWFNEESGEFFFEASGTATFMLSTHHV